LYTKLAEENELFEFVPELWSTMMEFGVRSMIDDGSIIKRFIVLMARYEKDDQVNS
jgi:hypothetical protein